MEIAEIEYYRKGLQMISDIHVWQSASIHNIGENVYLNTADWHTDNRMNSCFSRQTFSLLSLVENIRICLSSTAGALDPYNCR